MIDYDYRERRPAPPPDACVLSLRDAAGWILRQVSGAHELMAELRIKLFADGADKRAMLDLYRDPRIKGFTTNPTLMRKAGIEDYEAFARISSSPFRTVLFRLKCWGRLRRNGAPGAQGPAWGSNVYVKIPITNTRREPSLDLICRLSQAGIKLNITAILTLERVRDVCLLLRGGAPAYVSVFAGRIADTARPRSDHGRCRRNGAAHAECRDHWASAREALNIVQADQCGCHIITVTWIS